MFDFILRLFFLNNFLKLTLINLILLFFILDQNFFLFLNRLFFLNRCNVVSTSSNVFFRNFLINVILFENWLLIRTFIFFRNLFFSDLLIIHLLNNFMNLHRRGRFINQPFLFQFLLIINQF